MKNYELDTTMLPEVWVTWNSANGTIYMNPNGKRLTTPEPWMRTGVNGGNANAVYVGVTWGTRNKEKIWVKSGSKIYYAYAKYHEDINRLEVAAVTYDTSRKEAKHEWSYAGERYFIGKDKSIVNENGVRYTAYHNAKDGYRIWDEKNLISHLLRMNTNDHFNDEFKKFIGGNYFIIGNGTSVEIQYSWSFAKWYESVQKTRTNGKSQKLVDELVAIPLGDTDGLGRRFPAIKRYNGWRDEEIKNIIYFERVNDKWSVLRAFVRDDNNEVTEAWRVYFDDKNTTRIASKSNGEWIPSSQQNHWRFNSEFCFVNKNEAIEKCNRIKYTLSALKEEDGPAELITALRFPEVEQLYKLGCPKFAHKVSKSSTPKSVIKDMFGNYYKEKEKNILRQVGMTKHQLDKFYAISSSYDHWYSYGNMIAKMRTMFGDDLSHIDNNTFDKYIVVLSQLLPNFWGQRYLTDLGVDESKFWRNVARLYEKNRNSTNLLNDTLSLWHRIDYNNRPQVDWLFDSYSDIVRAHDAFNDIVTRQEAERQARYNARRAEELKREQERLKKVDEERKHYEFEDGDFVIRLPRDLREILDEGTRQRICIGGYTTRHANGETNIFFLRRKDTDSVPFYAIEMRNDSIVQIHGYCNRWLGNNPEAIPTVVRWLRKHNISCRNEILTCNATGYCSTGTYVTMPIVD